MLLARLPSSLKQGQKAADEICSGAGGSHIKMQVGRKADRQELKPTESPCTGADCITSLEKVMLRSSTLSD